MRTGTHRPSILPPFLMAMLAACSAGETADSADPAPTLGSLFTDYRHAEWSPDGSEFVVSRATLDGGDIIVLDRSGTPLRTVIATPATELTGEWSPDGATLVYYAAPVDGSYSVRLIGADGTDDRPFDPGFATASPRWSPDGTTLVFNSAGGDDLRQVFMSRPDGSDLRQLTFNDQGHSDYPSWSPDGQWVLFESNRDGMWNTWRILPDGTGLEQLTRDGSAGPRYSPDATRIVFHYRRNGTDYDIFLMDADGSNERLLAGGPGDQRLPEWSPDGQRIAFISNEAGHHDLFVVDVASGAISRITSQPAGELFTVLRERGRDAARKRFDEALAMSPRPRVFRDVSTVSRHAEWMHAAGRVDDARFLLDVGIDAFPGEAVLLELRDSLRLP